MSPDVGSKEFGTAKDLKAAQATDGERVSSKECIPLIGLEDRKPSEISDEFEPNGP